jgi:KaiC/GvpD/RAD55 family RecA-like ATPase
LDGDGNQINSEVLKQACEAQADMEDYWSKKLATTIGSKTWKRYDSLWRSALEHMHEKAPQAVPELRREREIVDQLNDAHYKLGRVTSNEEYSTKVYPAFLRFAHKWEEYARNVQQTLKRLCSPPMV